MTAPEPTRTPNTRARRRAPADGQSVPLATRRSSNRERSERRHGEDLVALLGHELRAPVSGLRSSAELLVHYLDGDLNSAEAQRAVRRIYSLSMRLSLMIQDLFDLAQCARGELETAQTEIDLLEVVASAVEIARTLPGMPLIAVDSTVDGDAMCGDARRLGGVVLNLLENASKYAAQTPHIDVRIREGDPDVLIDVEDHGPGIHPDDLPRVFEKHFRGRPIGPVEPVSARPDGGLGLGLFIAKRIVRAHRGHITVRSAVGVGTCFTISLPRSRR